MLSKYAFALFCSSSFIGAGLLFFLELMIAKMFLPQLGGSPEVWLGCICFFQIAVFAGYYYAHQVAKRYRIPRFLIVHLFVLTTSLLFLPIEIPTWLPKTTLSPTLWLFLALAISVGPLTLVLTSTSPLLQAWFAQIALVASQSPYRLYSYSNAGSLLFLLSYPCLIEPRFSLRLQIVVWGGMYIFFLLLILLCAWFPYRKAITAQNKTSHHFRHSPMTCQQRMMWLLLAAIPSSLLISTTQIVTTDIGAFPLLWVIPLSLYLITWILCFSKQCMRVHTISYRILPFVLITQILSLAWGGESALILRAIVHFVGLLVVALACHAELAVRQPHTSNLTSYYLLIAAGGCIGGLTNTLVCPAIFNTLVEYPIGLFVVAILRLLVNDGGSTQHGPIIKQCATALTILLLLGFSLSTTPKLLPFVTSVGIDLSGYNKQWLTLIFPAFVCLLSARFRISFALGVVALLSVQSIWATEDDRVLYRNRTFFGIYRVVEESDGSGNWRKFWHSSTMQGIQYDEEPWSSKPTAYYTSNGPLGDIMSVLQRDKSPRRLAIVGLGVGTASAYARPNWEISYYEIDPEIVHIATAGRYFSYVSASKGKNHFVVGDARLEMRTAPSQHFDAIIVDAFSSDAIPIHLLTIEALREYRDKLKPQGIMAFHITNRYLDLTPVFESAVAELQWAGRQRYDSTMRRQDWIDLRKYESHWVCLASIGSSLDSLGEHWNPIESSRQGELWTDKYSSLFTVLSW